MVRHHESLRLLVPPAKAGNAVVVSMEHARLARRSLRREQRFPAIENHTARANPSREIRRLSRLEVVLEERMRESIDLDEDDARLLARISLPVASRELADERAEERIVIAGREPRGQERIPDREDHRTDERIHRSV